MHSADWTDTAAMIQAATEQVDPALVACSKDKPPWRIALIVTRDAKTGASNVNMPFPNVGFRGFTKEELCLMKVIATIAVPPLPSEIDRITIIHVVDTTTSKPTLGAWNDIPTHLADVLKDHRDALAACSTASRTVRLVLDVRHGKTRVWLPDWQFRSSTGDGSTPAAEKKIRTCLTRVTSAWKVPVLPADLSDLHLAVKTR